MAGILLAAAVVAFAAWILASLAMDRGRLVAFVSSCGAWAPLAFFAIQLAQVIIAPIPGNVTGLAGGALFGPLWGAAIASAAMIIGSCLLFAFSRRFGKAAVARHVDLAKYSKLGASLSGRGAANALLGIFLFPFMPDDVACLLAGLTGISFRTFAALVLAGRLPSCVITALIGAGIYEGGTAKAVLYACAYYALAFAAYNIAQAKSRKSPPGGQGDGN